MKDFKLPQLSNEEMNNIFKSLKIGDELVKIDYSFWHCNYNIKTVKVKNITSKGNVRLDNDELLKNLSSGYYPINNEDVQECIKKINIENQVISKISYLPRENKTFINNLEYEDAVILNNILNKIFKDS